MLFDELAKYFEKLENITSRNQMTVVLAELFKKSSASEIRLLCYLIQGRVAPLYEPVEFGMADKMVVRAISLGLQTQPQKVEKIFKTTGDLGVTVENLKSEISILKRKEQRLRITEVFTLLEKVAYASGIGSQEEKIKQLGELLQITDPLSARYIVRILLGKLRLGFSDMTILDGLSWMIAGNKKHKDEIEASYSVRPDLGYIAETVKTKGIDGLKNVLPQPGTPILMARANRLTSAEDIFLKIGSCAVEYKYDGLRLQVHYESGERHQKTGQKIKMFSRNLEDVTEMFPDIAEAVVKQITASEVIFEGEVVAYNPKTGAAVPFQETMQRKRKYDIKQKAAEIPVKLYAFELLYNDGRSFLELPYVDRKKELKKIIKNDDVIIYAEEKIVDKAVQIVTSFKDSIEKHFEGIIAKKLNGPYEAGVRGWNWIKFKHAMSRKLADTLDVLVMGYTKGEGKRTAFGVGQFLTGVYDAKQDRFSTISKIGTGLTDEQFREFFKRVAKLHIKQKPALYEVDKLMEPDVWLAPGLVVEVSCDEITRSAVHTTGRIMEPSRSGKALSVKSAGFALRFPRLVRFRDDKRPVDATNVSEVEKMFAKQSV